MSKAVRVAAATVALLIGTSVPAACDDAPRRTAADDAVGAVLTRTLWWFWGAPDELEEADGRRHLRDLLSGQPAVAAQARSALTGRDDARVRWLAVGLLAGGEVEAAVAPLARASLSDPRDVVASIRDRRPWRRVLALWTVADREERIALPAVLEAIARVDDLDRRLAATALGAIGDGSSAAVEALVATMERADDSSSWAAQLALLRMGGDAARRAARFRTRRAVGLGSYADLPDAVLAGVTTLLASEAAVDREFGAAVLAWQSRPPAASVPSLVRGVTDPSSVVRWHCAWSLSRSSEPFSDAAKAALRSLLADEDPGLRAVGAVALVRSGERAPDLAPPLLDVLAEWPAADDLHHVSWLLDAARMPVALVGPVGSAEAAMDALVALGASTLAAARARSPGPLQARRNLAALLPRLGPEGLEASRALLRDEDGEVRRRAARGLARQGDVSAEVVGVLVRWTEDQAWTERSLEGVELLTSLGEPAVPALAQVLADEDAPVAVVAGALVRIGPRAAAAVPALLRADRAANVELLPGDQSGSVPTYLRVVAAVGPAAVPHLVAALGSDDADVRDRAYGAALELGSAARSMVPALRKAASEGRLQVDEAALERLEAPEPK